MRIIHEFKEFAMRGNVMDLAIGVIIGGAFGKIVTSLVQDIITPFISLLTGGINFSERTAVLKQGINGGVPVVLSYGAFIQNVIDFLIIAFVIFMMVKVINRIRRRRPEPKKEPEMTTEEKLLTEIRDALRTRE